jgi:hypothetical protein
MVHGNSSIFYLCGYVSSLTLLFSGGVICIVTRIFRVLFLVEGLGADHLAFASVTLGSLAVIVVWRIIMKKSKKRQKRLSAGSTPGYLRANGLQKLPPNVAARATPSSKPPAEFLERKCQ